MLWNYVNLILGILLLIFPGCVKYKGPGYTPNINLTKTSPSIPLKIDSRPLVDSSPPAGKESGYMTGSGSSATSKETLKGDLATLITTLLRGEFQRSNLFEAIDSDLPTPDLVLSGTIHRFYERTTEPLIGLCCGLLTGFIGLPFFIEEGAVDLEPTLSSPDGKIVKTYRKQADYDKWMNAYDGRAWHPYRHGLYLNKTMAEVTTLLRDMILADRTLLTNSKPSP